VLCSVAKQFAPALPEAVIINHKSMSTVTNPTVEKAKATSTENHKKAAIHLEAAAKHHNDAAKHHEDGNLEKAGLSSSKAFGHQTIAHEAHKEVSKNLIAKK
jgi:hypothetical protein